MQVTSLNVHIRGLRAVEPDQAPPIDLTVRLQPTRPGCDARYRNLMAAARPYDQSLTTRMHDISTSHILLRRYVGWRIGAQQSSDRTRIAIETVREEIFSPETGRSSLELGYKIYFRRDDKKLLDYHQLIARFTGTGCPSFFVLRDDSIASALGLIEMKATELQIMSSNLAAAETLMTHLSSLLPSTLPQALVTELNLMQTVTQQAISQGQIVPIISEAPSRKLSASPKKRRPANKIPPLLHQLLPSEPVSNQAQSEPPRRVASGVQEVLDHLRL